MINLFRIVALLFVPLVVSACTGSAYHLPQVSKEETTALEAQIETDSTPLKTYNRSDAHYKKRINRIANRLRKSAKPLCEAAEHSCHFDIQYDNQDIANAYAHEEYKITVLKGFLKYLKNDHEMAAVIAHEMGHHIAEHNQETTQNAATGAAVSGLLTAVLIGMANANNPYGYDAYQQQQQQETLQNMMEAGAELGMLSYSKEQEREADLIGSYLLEHANYDLKKAQNLLYVMSKISADDVVGKGPNKAALLDTHPPSAERYIAWQKVMEEIDANEDKLPYQKNTE